MQKNHPHPGFASWRLAARIGLCAVGIGLATAGFAAVRSPLAQEAKTLQNASTSTSTAGESPAIQRSPTYLRYLDLKTWYGLPVHSVVFTGVSDQDLVGVKDRLALQAGKKLTEEDVKESLHALFATGLYRSIVAEGVETGGQVTVTFDGAPQLFLRRLYIQGMKQDTLAAQIQRATRLELGESFTVQELDQATDHLRHALERNGFHVATVSVKTVPAGGHHLVDVIYTVNAGRQAKVGAVKATGTTAMTDEKFRKIAKLKRGSTVTANTVPRALTKLRKQYQKQDRLEATVRAGPETFNAATNSVDYQFQVNRGPVVRISATGAKISQRDLKRLVPVYDEGAVDPDLLDEGDGNLRDHFQKKGYFDVHVTHVVEQPGPNEENIIYRIDPGTPHKVVSVTVTGNHYFDRSVVKERLAVQAADRVNSHGIYSQQLQAQDVAAIQALYKSNGFGNVTVTPVVTDSDAIPGAPKAKVAVVRVTYEIHEGVQQKIGRVELSGVEKVSKVTLLEQMNTRPGEPFSLTTLAGDRLQLFDYYYRHGFSQVELEFEQHPDPLDPNRIDIDVRVHEGNPFYVNHVLVSGLHYTKPRVV
ncbi:MAG TPA: POTRA domain-containing protein, partial [Acidobacteriaceae bacterium]|nr:POTRA domain-containing protein [Acidobacteriaceae bacterium]